MQIAELAAAVAKATKLREAEQAKSTETIADAQEAQTAVAQALTVWGFYATAVKPTAFVQQEPPPESSDEPSTGMGGETGSAAPVSTSGVVTWDTEWVREAELACMRLDLGSAGSARLLLVHFFGLRFSIMVKALCIASANSCACRLGLVAR